MLPREGRALKMVLITAALLLAAYLLLCLQLFLRQRSISFHPAPPNHAARRQLEARWPGSRGLLAVDGVGEVEFFRLFRGPGLPLLLYFGGNALDAAEMALPLAGLQGFNIVLWNYPGYGESGGRPSQGSILRAALAVYDRFAPEAGGCSRILLVGRSLGSAVATYVAARRCCRGLVLITPFDSLVSLGRWRYPYVPVSLLLRERFPSKEWLSRVDVPLLMVLAQRDETVPHRFSHALVEGYRGVEEVVIRGVDHATIADSPALYRAIGRFWEGLR